MAIVNLRTLLETLEMKSPQDPTLGPWEIDAYSEFVASLYEEGGNLAELVLRLVLEDENCYVKAVASGLELPEEMEEAVALDLVTLNEIARLTPSELLDGLQYEEPLALWGTTDASIPDEFRARMPKIRQYGYGIFAKYRAFTIGSDGNLIPVKHPDEQDLSMLFGYERERNLIVKNTQALIEGENYCNMLLYGDAGTGKSSTIKAVAKECAKDGVRLIEMRKDQLFLIPDLMEELAGSPLKFILFIDDLSFSKNDDNFSALKAVLEGSVTSSSSNIAVYATSNRRHLVKESMKDRDGDELFVNDTLQEISSLSARFGLTITFQRPGKDDYLNIVDNLAREKNVDLDPETLHMKAEAHAIRANGRSPRVAQQFIKLLLAGVVDQSK